MHGEEARAYGDIGYIGASKRLEAIKKNKNGKKGQVFNQQKRTSEIIRLL